MYILRVLYNTRVILRYSIFHLGFIYILKVILYRFYIKQNCIIHQYTRILYRTKKKTTI